MEPRDHELEADPLADDPEPAGLDDDVWQDEDDTGYDDEPADDESKGVKTQIPFVPPPTIVMCVPSAVAAGSESARGNRSAVVTRPVFGSIARIFRPPT